MKKFLLILLSLLFLCGCSEIGKKDIDPNQRYYSLIENIVEHEGGFLSSSNHYDINVEMAKIDDGYRYYVTIDNPRSALYDVEALAIEKDIDYTKTMAANVGIFEESEYSLIPNQKNPDKGYVSGLVISGVTENPEITLYIYVSFKNEDFSNIRTEYFKLDTKYEAE